MFLESFKDELADRALLLNEHNAAYYQYAGEFTLGELIILWELCCESSTELPFGTKIHDALHLCHNYFDRHKAWLTRTA